MAFNRKFEMSIGTNGTGLLISELDIDFNITRSRAFSENTAEFVIFNAKEETRQYVVQKNNNLIFKAGYEDEGPPQSIFIGNIIKGLSVRKEPNWETTINAATAMSISQALETLHVSLSYTNNVPLSKPILDIAAAYGLNVLGLENITEIQLDNGFVFAGTARMALKYCYWILQVNQIGMYMDNSEIVLYRLDNKDSKFGSVYLDFKSGLLSAKDITEYNPQLPAPQFKRIEFECLLIPQLRPNGLIQLVHPLIKGVFSIDKLNFIGNNYGGDCKVTGEATG